MAEETTKDEMEESSGAPLGFASAEELLSLDDLDTVEVVVLKWNHMVKLRQLTKAQMQQLRKDTMKSDSKGNAQIDLAVYERKLLQASIVEPELTDAQMDKFMLKSGMAIEFLLGEINKLNGMGVGAQAGMSFSFR